MWWRHGSWMVNVRQACLRMGIALWLGMMGDKGGDSSLGWQVGLLSMRSAVSQSRGSGEIGIRQRTETNWREGYREIISEVEVIHVSHDRLSWPENSPTSRCPNAIETLKFPRGHHFQGTCTRRSLHQR